MSVLLNIVDKLQIEQLVACCENLKSKEFVDYDDKFIGSNNARFDIEQQIILEDLALGTITGTNTFNTHYDTAYEVDYQMQATFHHSDSRPYVDIELMVEGDDFQGGIYKLEARYSAFQSVIMQPGREKFEVYLKMIKPFLLYELEEGQPLNDRSWVRAHEIVTQPNVNIGKCNVMKLVFDTYPTKLPSPLTVMKTLKFYMDHKSPLPFKVGNVFSIRAYARCDYKSWDAEFFKTKFFDFTTINSHDLPPSILYAALALFTVSYQFEDELNQFLKGTARKMNANNYFYNYLKNICDKRQTYALKEALHDVFLAIDNNDEKDGIFAHLVERIKYHSKRKSLFRKRPFLAH